MYHSSIYNIYMHLN